MAFRLRIGVGVGFGDQGWTVELRLPWVGCGMVVHILPVGVLYLEGVEDPVRFYVVYYMVGLDGLAVVEDALPCLLDGGVVMLAEAGSGDSGVLRRVADLVSHAGFLLGRGCFLEMCRWRLR